MRFFILLAKKAFGKKDPSRRCGTVPLQQLTGGFSSGGGGGGGLRRTRKTYVSKLVGPGACSPGKISNLSLLKWL